LARRSDAIKWRSTQLAELAKGSWRDPASGKTTLATYAERWMQTRADKAPATRDRDRSYLRSMILPTFGPRRVEDIRASEIVAWVASLGRADSTRTKALQILRGVLDLARRDHAISVSPAADVKAPGMVPERVGRALSDEAGAALLDAAEEVAPDTAAVVWLMLRAGLRAGEALALRRRDVDLSAGTITVAGSLNRRGEVVAVKGRKREDQGRTIPIPADLADRLAEHLQGSLPRLDGALFASPTGMCPVKWWKLG
jgi:integrase